MDGRQLSIVARHACYIEGDDEDHFHHWDLFWSDINSEDYFHYKHLERFLPEDLSLLEPDAELIPRSSFEMTAPPDLTPAPTPPPEDSYIKRLDIKNYHSNSGGDDGMEDAKMLLIQEALVCEDLAKHPHPNVCEYRGFMIGLCFKGYSKNLSQAVKDGDPVDSKAIVEGIRLGLKHMHALGFVHNDVNLTNIMLASSSYPVLIDFDSCQESGSSVKCKEGAPGWSKESDLVVEENDWYSLEKIEAWLTEKTAKIHDDFAETESNQGSISTFL